MFRDTIFNNIAYGSNVSHVEQVLHAAEVANAHGFISKLPDAYDTMLGERGVGLSGGEKQRVSIARALAKNPKILLCDEPTGALDYKTSKQILSLLHRTCRQTGTTVVVITHEKNLVDHFQERVIRLEEGKMIEDRVGGMFE